MPIHTSPYEIRKPGKPSNPKGGDMKVRLLILLTTAVMLALMLADKCPIHNY